MPKFTYLAKDGPKNVDGTVEAQSKEDALQKIDLGPESKVVLQFKQRFWPETMAILSNPGYPQRSTPDSCLAA